MIVITNKQTHFSYRKTNYLKKREDNWQEIKHINWLSSC